MAPGPQQLASAETKVTSSAGTPLNLVAKSGYAPLKVNSSKTVTNLSADKLDGLSSGSFAKASAKTGIVKHDGTFDGIGAKCPTGTVSTGGGGFDPYGWEIGYSGPDWSESTNALIPNSWIALDVDGYVLNSYVNCMSMSGAAIPGAMTASDYQTAGGFAMNGPEAKSSVDGDEKTQERPHTAHATGK